MACKATESGKVSRRGQPSIEWYKDGKPQYYCYGYIDKMADELLPECKECRSHVIKAQDDLDKYNRRNMPDLKPLPLAPNCGAKMDGGDSDAAD